MAPVRLLSPLLVFGGACLLSAGTLAAFTAQTSNPGNDVEAGSVRLSDNGSGGSLLGLVNAGAGGSDTSCIRVTSDGSLPSNVRLRAASSGTLAKHLRVKIERGTGAAAWDDCSGFTPDPRDYYGLGSGIVYDGRLSDLPSGWGAGVADPSDTLFASSDLPLLEAANSIEGLWLLGERVRRADTFAGSPGALLTSRGELKGSNWARQDVSTTDLVLTASERGRPDTPGLALYRVSTAGGAETVTADFTAKSASGEAGLMTRMQTTGDTGYLVRYTGETGVWELVAMNAGAPTVLDAWNGPIATGGTAHVVVEQNGSTTAVRIDGAQRLSATDATFAATGRTGVRLVGTANAQGDSVGVQIDNFRSFQPGTSANAATYGTAASASGGPPVTPGAHASPTDDAWGLTFNGTSQTVSLPAPGLATAATIAGWFKVTGGSDLLRDSTTGAATGWSLGFDDGGGTMKFRSSDQVFDTGIAFAPLRGAWHHHALVRNGTAVEYYLDGRRVFSGTTAATTAPVSPFFLMRDGTGTAYTAGRADQIGIWSRALGADELAAIHDGVSAPAAWTNGEQHWYRIEVTVDEDPAAASSSATGQFTWEARSR